jgi:SnoaL-like domain
VRGGHKPSSRYLRALAFAGAIGIGLGRSSVGADLPQTQARLDRLEIAVIRSEDIRAIKKLQRSYGFYADRGLWADLADLFTDDATADYPGGIYLGKASIRKEYFLNLGEDRLGLSDGRIYNHIILQPVIDESPDGTTAVGRWRVLGMLGRYHQSASWAGDLYRFEYVKQHGVWKIKTLKTYSDFGAPYGTGWVAPKPGSGKFRFHITYKADRPHHDPCDSEPSVCVAPFPYPNPGLPQPRNVAVSAVDRASRSAPTVASERARAADLAGRVQRLLAAQAVTNLQRAYGYYLDWGLWRQAADLFVKDGTLEVGQGGVYVGRKHILRSLELSGPPGGGLRPGQLNDHLQIEPVVDVAPDGRSARGRIFELEFVGGGGAPARIVQGVEENEYVRRGGVWMIESVHDYTVLATDYDEGWAKDAQPAPTESRMFPPDRPPTEVYESYPKVYIPTFHFANPATGRPTQYPAGTRVQAPAVRSGAPAARFGVGKTPPTISRPAARLDAEITEAERGIRRVEDYDEIENLQDAYGYYRDKSLWNEIVDLFAKEGTLEIGHSGVQVGRQRILAFLRASGPEGPVKGVLDSQLQLQPLIDVAPDGKTARIRSRLLQFTRSPDGRPVLGAGVYENELVKQDGVWRFKRFHLYRTLEVYYRGGWAKAGAGGGMPGSDQRSADSFEVFPSRHTPPFHYRNPVTGR